MRGPGVAPSDRQELGPHRVNCAQSLFTGLLFLLVLAGAGSARAQSAAEYGALTSHAGARATGSQPGTSIFSPERSVVQSKFAHIPLQKGARPEVTNRRALEERAGKDAGKLLLRSTPPEAQIWIDGAFVGKTPVLLILAPRKYRVEMRGGSLELAAQTVDLLPHETKEVVLSLAPRYPARVRLR